MSHALVTLVTVRHRARAVRLSLIVEPRDLWVGLFIGPTSGTFIRRRSWYVCLVPMLVLKLEYLHGVTWPSDD